MQKTFWGGVIVLGILVAGFVFVAGCSEDACRDGLCGTWYRYDAAPTTTAPVTPDMIMQLHPDQTITMTTKSRVQSGRFGNSVPGPDSVAVGTWERPNDYTVILRDPSVPTNALVFQYETGVPRLFTYGYQYVFYQNQDDWRRWTKWDGTPVIYTG